MCYESIIGKAGITVTLQGKKHWKLNIYTIITRVLRLKEVFPDKKTQVNSLLAELGRRCPFAVWYFMCYSCRHWPGTLDDQGQVEVGPENGVA